MKFKYRQLLFASLAMAFAMAFPEPVRAGIEVHGWAICRDDVSTLEDLSRCARWEPVRLPVIMKARGAARGGIVSCWFRGRLDLDGDISRYRGISIGSAGLGADLYINGRSVVKGFMGASTYLSTPEFYLLHEGAIHEGSNEIIIRVDSYPGRLLTLKGPVVVHEEWEFEVGSFLNNSVYIHVPMGIAFLCLGFAAAMMLYYFLTRRELVIIFASLSLVILAMKIILNYLPFALVPYDICFAIDWSLFPLILGLLVLLVQSIYRSYSRPFYVVGTALITVCVPLVYFSGGTVYGVSLRPVLVTAICIVMLPVYVLLLMRLNARQKNLLRLTISGICLGLASFLVVVDIIYEALGGATSTLLMVYSAPVFITIFAVLFGRERRLRNQELDFLYESLRQSRDREPTITESSEEKLKRVIAFIDANYHSDISREGLAAAVDMNANYMGSLFKSYTGRRINEYINGLRVGEAAERLRKGDEKIIDIALSVGFESLATFNRAFKGIMGATPTDYRAGKD